MNARTRSTAMGTPITTAIQGTRTAGGAVTWTGEVAVTAGYAVPSVSVYATSAVTTMSRSSATAGARNQTMKVLSMGGDSVPVSHSVVPPVTLAPAGSVPAITSPGGRDTVTREFTIAPERTLSVKPTLTFSPDCTIRGPAAGTRVANGEPLSRNAYRRPLSLGAYSVPLAMTGDPRMYCVGVGR